MLSEKDINHVIGLANLDIKPDEKDIYLKQLAKIFDYMEVLNNVDLAKYPPNANISAKPTPLREDIIKKYEDLNIKINTPSFENHCFSVPKILEE